jgi:hypothetical protein
MFESKAEIKLSKFIRWVYVPLVKIRVMLTGQQPDMDKVMRVVEKHTHVKIIIKGKRNDSRNSEER